MPSKKPPWKAPHELLAKLRPPHSEQLQAEWPSSRSLGSSNSLVEVMKET